MRKACIFIAPRWSGARKLIDSLHAALDKEVDEVWRTSNWDDHAAQKKIEGTDLIF